MNLIRLHISYDGTGFYGWQKQKGDVPTIQSSLEQALAKMFDQPIKTTASGRTDAGVHAREQVVHFNIPKEKNYSRILHALNSLTPDNIVIRAAYLAPKEFHSLFSATHKTYKYLINNNPLPSPNLRHSLLWIRNPLNLKRLNELSAPLIGEQDFASFQTKGTPVKTTVRKVYKANWIKKDSGLVELTLSGNGFLKQMVRNIVGTIMYLHDNNGTCDDLKEILLAQDRSFAKGTAKPHGLYLYKVYYPQELDKKCKKL